MPKKKNAKSITEIKAIKEFIKKIAGKEAISVVKYLEKNKGKKIKDEELASKLKIKLTKIRTILNTLSYKGIVGYDKKKDANSGWFHYNWYLNDKKIIELLIYEQKKLEKSLKELEKIQDSVLFACENLCFKGSLDEAYESNFICSVCGNNLNSKSLEEIKEKVKKDIVKINDSIEQLNKIIK